MTALSFRIGSPSFRASGPSARAQADAAPLPPDVELVARWRSNLEVELDSLCARLAQEAADPEEMAAVARRFMERTRRSLGPFAGLPSPARSAEGMQEWEQDIELAIRRSKRDPRALPRLLTFWLASVHESVARGEAADWLVPAA